MDTDDLSNETYKAVIIEAENFDHDLTLRFGVLASGCKNEAEYLKKSVALISEISNLNKDELSDMFFGKFPDVQALNLTLKRIIGNIEEVRKIPEAQRHYEF